MFDQKTAAINTLAAKPEIEISGKAAEIRSASMEIDALSVNICNKLYGYVPDALAEKGCNAQESRQFNVNDAMAETMEFQHRTMTLLNAILCRL
jgi:hypothetical protein